MLIVGIILTSPRKELKLRCMIGDSSSQRWPNLGLTMRAKNKTCCYCDRPLTKIDRYGEMLVGCIECNRWGRPADKTLVMELMEDDLKALRASAARRRGD